MEVPRPIRSIVARMKDQWTLSNALSASVDSRPIWYSNCSTVLGLCHIFLFKTCQIFLIGERSGLQADLLNTRTLLLRRHAVVLDAVCSIALSCWIMQGLLWKRHCLDANICCSKTWIHLTALMVPFKMCKLPTPYALMHPHTIRDASFWTNNK